MNVKIFLDKVCEQIKYQPARKDIAEELELHIEDIKSDYLCKGYSEKDAEEKAVEQMGKAEEIGKKLDKIHRPQLDWKLLILAFILISFGFLVAINKGFFAYDPVEDWTFNGETFLVYFLSIFLATMISILIYITDYKKICKYSLQLYILATGLNIIAYIFGHEVGGTILWGLPFVNVSPTVFSIPLYIVSFAGFINAINNTNITKAEGRKFNMSIIKIILTSVFSIICLLSINSGSAIVVTMVYLIIATIQLFKTEKNRVLNLVKLWGISIILFLVIAIICVKPYDAGSRIETIIYQNLIEEDTKYETMLNERRNEVINSAKLFGRTDIGIWYFSNDTDFVFLSLLEGYGWIVSATMVLFVIILNIKLIINAIKIKETYGKLIIIGIASMFILETIINLAINFGINIAADFGIPLVSYGKVSLIVNIVCIALVLSVYRRKNISIYDCEIQKAND